MAGAGDNQISQNDMIKLILPMVARIEGKVDTMMMELAKLKAKEGNTSAPDELDKLYKTADTLGANAMELALKAL